MDSFWRERGSSVAFISTKICTKNLERFNSGLEHALRLCYHKGKRAFVTNAETVNDYHFLRALLLFRQKHPDTECLIYTRFPPQWRNRDQIWRTEEAQILLDSADAAAYFSNEPDYSSTLRKRYTRELVRHVSAAIVAAPPHMQRRSCAEQICMECGVPVYSLNGEPGF